MKILILDAANYNTLAIIRYLGPIKDLELHVAGYNKLSVGFFSTYIREKFMLPNPKDHEGKFMDELFKLLKADKYDLLMPVGYKTHELCSENREEIEKYTKLVIPAKESFALASNKTETYKLAEQIGVPCPKTYHASSYKEIENLDVVYPAVVKAPFELGRSMVAYVYNKKELIEESLKIKNELNLANNVIPVIQEYVKGDGYGFFAFYDNGVCKAIFMHKRVREYPASGGASVCAEGFYDEVLAGYGKKILDHLKWNGVAMVEFKKDAKDNTYKLMEINPKFWGSLELALASGVNFPLYLVKKAANESLPEIKDYKKIRFHWILNGEVYHFFSRPSSLFSIVKDLFIAKSDISLRDPMPNLVQILLIFVHYFKQAKKAFS